MKKSERKKKKRGRELWKKEEVSRNVNEWSKKVS